MRWLAAGAMVLAGLVLFAVWWRMDLVGLGPGDTSFVNADRPGINAHNSPSVARDLPPRSEGRPGPGHADTLVVADRIDTPRFSCSVSRSTTDGATWEQLALPLPPEAPNCHQPDVAYAGPGRLLVLYTATGGRFNQPVGVWLQRFDGETPAGAPVRVAPAEAFHARMAVDGDRVWVTWIQVDGAAEKPLGFGPTPAPLRMARSSDGGATFSAPQTVSEGRRVVQPTPVALPDGRIVVGALDLADDFDDYEARHGGQGGPPHDGRWRIVTFGSTDGGATFGPPVTVAGDLVPPQRIIVNLAPAPSFARDARGSGLSLLAAWDAGVGDGRDVFVAKSDEEGATWSEPIRLRRPRGQFLPALAISPEGRIDVLFYDRSADPEDIQAHVRLASSADFGRRFYTTPVSDIPFDTRVGFGSLQGIPLLGSRLAVLSYTDRALAFWSDTSRGTIDDSVQDLAVAAVKTEDRDDLRRNVGWVSAWLVGLGLFLARPRRRPRTM